MALDEPKDSDKVFDLDGLQFIVDSELHASAQPINIDLTYTGFTVESSLQLSGGSCSSGSCSTGGCSSGGSCSC